LQKQELPGVRQQLASRLIALQAEYEAGQKALAHLEAQKAVLKETLLRIGGAIQVLQEELEKSPEPQPLGSQGHQPETNTGVLDPLAVTPA
jgi:predicted nuclease with TOPRIM domain